MLIVFDALPAATPFKSGFGEKAVAEVAGCYLVREVACSVDVGRRCGRLYVERTVGAFLDVRVVEGVDVDSEALGMLGKHFAARHDTVAETAAVVVAHLSLVVGVVVVREHHAADDISGIIELSEDAHESCGNLFVAHHFAEACLLTVPVQESQVAQVVPTDVRVWLECLALHALPHRVGDAQCDETTVDAIFADGGLRDGTAGLPLLKQLTLVGRYG